MLFEVNLNRSLAVSVFIHLIILFLLPNLRPALPYADKLFEVEIVKLPKVKVRKTPKRVVQKSVKRAVTKRLPPRRVLEAMPLVKGRLQVAAPPKVELPQRPLVSEAPQIDAAQLDKRVYDEPAGTPAGVPQEKMAYFASERDPLPFERHRFGEKQAPPPTELNEGGIKEFPLPELESPVPLLPALGVQDYGGTVGRRQVLMAGSVPEVKSVSRAVTVRIRFDVMPDGTVVNPRPESKGGDAALERTALKIAKKYKFVPLPPDVEQIVQWGILPVTFKQ